MSDWVIASLMGISLICNLITIYYTTKIRKKLEIRRGHE
jgi:hypothetical protein